MKLKTRRESEAKAQVMRRHPLCTPIGSVIFAALCAGYTEEQIDEALDKAEKELRRRADARAAAV